MLHSLLSTQGPTLPFGTSILHGPEDDFGHFKARIPETNCRNSRQRAVYQQVSETYHKGPFSLVQRIPWLKVVPDGIWYGRCPIFIYLAQRFGEQRTPSGMSKNMATLRKQHSKFGLNKVNWQMTMNEIILPEEHPIILLTSSSYLHNNRIESDGFCSTMEFVDSMTLRLGNKIRDK